MPATVAEVIESLKSSKELAPGSDGFPHDSVKSVPVGIPVLERDNATVER